MWGIMYYVSGGISTHTSKWLKDKGVVYETESFDEADARALALTKKSNDGTGRQIMSSRTTFHYSATER